VRSRTRPTPGGRKPARSTASGRHPARSTAGGRNPARPTASGRNPARLRRRVFAALVAIVVAFGLVTARILVWPATGAPARVNAIVMLAGPGDRLPVALELAREHRAPVLVVSQGWQGYGGPCPAPVPGVKLICFDPDPPTTRGEAEALSRLAKQYGWTSVLLVTTRTQDTRARIIVGRCFTGSVYVDTAPLPLSNWPYEIAYGWGALFKALFVDRTC
jgi:uncharacterized SAM-binding protein YcdF (DUF218 family)